MTETEMDQLTKRLAFQDEKFLAKLSAKTVELLRSHVRTIQLQLPEIPKHIITEALVVFTAMEIEAGLSRGHAIHFLRKLADALEESNTVTVQ